jgi:hypothetical protein
VQIPGGQKAKQETECFVSNIFSLFGVLARKQGPFKNVAAKRKLCLPLAVGDQGRPYAVALKLQFFIPLPFGRTPAHNLHTENILAYLIKKRGESQEKT